MGPIRPAGRGVALAVAVALSWAGVGLGPIPRVVAQAACTAEAEPNDRPEGAPSFAGEVCLTGTLVEEVEQDLFFWEVAPQDGVTTWAFTMRGVPTAITSAHVFALPDPVVFPIVDVAEVFRADSDAHLGTPPITTETRFAPGHYLVGVSRGFPGFNQEITDDRTYELRIARSGVLPAAGDVEPNDEPASATPVAGGFELLGDLAGSADAFRWALTEDDAARSWRIEAVTSVGAVMNLALDSSDGQALTAREAAADGSAALHDLRLPAGDHIVTLRGAAEGVQPYILRAIEVTEADIDPEPNDTPDHAVPLDPATLTARGRLAAEGDVDRYILDVDAELAGHLLDVTLAWSDGTYRGFCLTNEAGTMFACPEGEGAATISSLVLPEGRYILDVSGTSGLEDRYELRVAPGAAAAADREVEPNDLPDTATTWDPTVTMHGSATGSDVDTFRVRVDAGPALWSLDASGVGIAWLAWTGSDGTPIGAASIADDGSRAGIDDLRLVRGEHTLAIQADGDYELTLVELGPPVPGAEAEPNDDPEHAETLSVGAMRTGRLPTSSDWDLYRFSLTAPTHVILRVEPPADGGVEMTLRVGLETVVSRSGEPGEAIVEDLLLPPADYDLHLRALTPGREPYALTLEWADPFVLLDDQEPNDSVNQARLLPVDLGVHGTARSVTNDDWYELPPLQPPGTLRIRAEGEQVHLQGLTDGSQTYDLTRQDDQVTYAADGLPSGVPLFLQVTTQGDYELSVSGDGLAALPEQVDPPVELTLRTDPDSVAAFRPERQELAGSLTIASSAATAIDLSLDGVASQWGWTVRPDRAAVTVPAGGSIDVPVAIDVPPDAWSRDPVRVTVRARADDGGQRTAFADVVVDPYAAPVGAGSVWSVPEALLGGLNVASAALGAVPGGTIDPAAEAALYDGVTPDSFGFSTGYALLPVDIDVDLAGDDPVPVVGTIVHPLGIVSELSQYPRGFDLLLSPDGTTWESALSGELAPLAVDQAFELPAPMEARFARLRLRSKYGASSGYMSLAEWKVVAAPGATPSADRLDIADPALGGHIVWMDPWLGIAPGRGVLDADLARQMTGYTLRDEAAFVIGFQDDRAAQVTELAWVDPDGTDPAARLETLEVAVAVDSPTGPWRSLGMWSLERADDGSVASFPLPPDTWARFVRLVAPIPPTAVELAEIELPGKLRVTERATDGEYRSVFGEWGDSSPLGPYEWLAEAEVPVVGEDAGDTADTASPLAPEAPVIDEVRFEVDEDWYVLTVPEGQDTLSIELRSQPPAAVEPTLFDDLGREVPLTVAPGDASSVRAIAVVRPAETYRLRVRQPHFSSVVTFDLSGSIAQWHPRILRALRGFTADVQPGREAIMLAPFEEKPLLEDWSDDPVVLREAVDSYDRPGGSSAAGVALFDAMTLLADRPGIRGILVLHDAEDLGFHATVELWRTFGRIRPVIFSVLVSSLDPPAARDLFQDWAGVNGGFYQYATTQADLDKAFARMAAWLRRPADYSISWTASSVEHAPSTLTVVPAEGADVPIGGGAAVELILDTSGSMLEELGTSNRILVAKEVLFRVVGEALPEGLPVALRTFKAKKKSCDTELAVPLGPLDRYAMSKAIGDVVINKGTRTPLGAALGAVIGDLGEVTGPRVVVLVTDGAETCKGDPAAAVQALREAGFETTVNVVGFALDSEELKAEMASWAQLGGGTFVDAQDQEALLAGMGAALRAPYRVYDGDGALVAGGVVGGPAIELPPGIYRVEVLTEPAVTFTDVVVPIGGSVELTVGEEGP